MALDDDWVIIPWVVNSAAGGDFIRLPNGELELLNRFFNDGNTKAPQIRLYKIVNGKTVYISECVPDSSKKRVYVTSSYKTKQLLNIDPDGSAQPTSKTTFGDHATKGSIVGSDPNVKNNYSTSHQHLSDIEKERDLANDLEAMKEEKSALERKNRAGKKIIENLKKQIEQWRGMEKSLTTTVFVKRHPI